MLKLIIKMIIILVIWYFLISMVAPGYAIYLAGIATGAGLKILA